MPYVQWTPEYSTNHPVFDQHHQQLIDILNTLYENRDESATQRREIVGVALMELKQYATYHFSAEEEFLQSIRFPEYEAHCREHRAYIEAIHTFIQEYRRGGKTLGLRTFEFLNNWLLTHILINDKKYASYALPPHPTKE